MGLRVATQTHPSPLLAMSCNPGGLPGVALQFGQISFQ